MKSLRPIRFALVMSLLPLVGCQSYEEALAVMCSAPSNCDIQRGDVAGVVSCVEAEIQNEDGRALLERLEEMQPRTRYGFLVEQAEKSGLKECPVAATIGDATSMHEAIELLCARGHECRGDGPKVKACLMQLLEPSLEAQQRYALEDARDRSLAVEKAKREYKLLREDLPTPCKTIDEWSKVDWSDAPANRKKREKHKTQPASTVNSDIKF